MCILRIPRILLLCGALFQKYKNTAWMLFNGFNVGHDCNNKLTVLFSKKIIYECITSISADYIQRKLQTM